MSDQINRKELERCYFDGLTDKEAAERLGCHHNVVYLWRKAEGLPANGGLFAWQDKIDPYDFETIPRKYWAKKYREVGKGVL